MMLGGGGFGGSGGSGESKHSFSAEQADVLVESIDPLRSLFHAGGVGLRMSVLDSGSCAFVRSLLGLFDVNTEGLIDLYNAFSQSTKLLSGQNDGNLTANHILNILASRTREKLAQRFVRETLDHNRS